MLSRLDDRGWTPGRADFAALLELIDGERSEDVVRAMARAGLPAAVAALEPVSAGRVALIGRVARTEKDPRLLEVLFAALSHEDPKVRKAAIVSLGKVRAPGVEEALVARHAAASDIDKRAIVVSLGKVGGEKSLALVRAAQDSSTTATRAKLMLERTAARGESSIDLDAKLPAPVTIAWRCRRGLEAIVLEQAGKGTLGKGEVTGERSGTLRAALAVRSALDACIVVPLEGRSPADAIASEPVIAAMKAWTKGQVRFRAEFLGGGHRRSALWEIAEKVAERTTEVMSDPTDASWDVLIDEEGQRLLLKPKAFEDPRFAYRVSDIPAASHPTIAAALAHVGGQRHDDVVWDPFVGSGLELIERARSGPYARLVGSDIDEAAIESAKKNLASAGVKASLVVGDARTQRVNGVTLVLTNPPMGRRLVRDKSLGELYDALIENVRASLVPGGRMVWLSVMAERTAGMARTVGFTVDRGRPVDVGGFEAEPQIFRAPAREASFSDRGRPQSRKGRRPSR